MRKRYRGIILAAGDILILLCSMILAVELRDLTAMLGDTTDLYQVLATVGALWIITYYCFGLYDERQLIFRQQLAPLLLAAQLLNIAVSSLIFYLFPVTGEAPKTILFIALGLVTILTYLWRHVAYTLAFMKSDRRWLVVNEDEAAATTIVNELGQRSWHGKHSVILIQRGRREDTHSIILDHIYNQQVGYLVLDMTSTRGQRLFAGLYHLVFDDVYFFDFDEMFEELTGRVRLESQQPQFFIAQLRRPGYEHVKRFADVLVATIVIALLVVPASILGVFSSRRRQVTKRTFVGQNHHLFVMLEWPYVLLNFFERFLAIFRGDLSVVGASLVPEEYYRDVSKLPGAAFKFLVKPGLITHRLFGIKDRPNQQNLIDRLEYDLYYVKRRSFSLDGRLVARYLISKLRRR